MLPQVGIGLLSKLWKALTRNSVIQSGSFFSAEISLTTCSDNPESKRIVAFSGSCQPALYSPTASLASVAAIIISPLLFKQIAPGHFRANHSLYLLTRELILDPLT